MIIIHTNVVNSNAFNYKNKITGNTHSIAPGAPGHDANKVGKQDVELTIPLKYLGHFLESIKYAIN